MPSPTSRSSRPTGWSRAARRCSSSRHRPRSVAGLLHGGRRPAPPARRVVCTVTGNGLKDPEWAISGAPKPITVPVDGRGGRRALGLADDGACLPRRRRARARARHQRQPRPGLRRARAGARPATTTWARVIDGGLSVDVAGEGADDLARDESHLVVRAMRARVRRAGRSAAPGSRSPAPTASRRGAVWVPPPPPSSPASCSPGRWCRRAATRLLATTRGPRLATELEGHPDNVAACLLGGLTSPGRAGTVRRRRRDVDPAMLPVALVPPFTASTELARGLLPDTVPHADAAFAAGRAALLVAALTGTPRRCSTATEDRLHQSYRAPAMPDSLRLVGRLRADRARGGDLGCRPDRPRPRPRRRRGGRSPRRLSGRLGRSGPAYRSRRCPGVD